MNVRRWIVLTIATILSVTAADIAIAFLVDPYGMWRDPAGRQLPVAVITNGRKAKFLLSKHYVPANFDSLIIGPSILASWNVPSLAGTRVYNLSIDGGNAVEEKLVLDQALQRGHYKIAVIVLAPINTSSREVKGGLDRTTPAEALASFHLYIQEAAYALRALHHGAGYIDIASNGQYTFHSRKSLHPEDVDPTHFQIDPIALSKFRDMIVNLKRQTTSIVYVAPPLYEPFYQLHRAEFDGYLKTMLPLLPQAPVINFQDAEYKSLRNDPDNFVDCEHMETRGSDKFSALLRSLAPAALASEK